MDSAVNNFLLLKINGMRSEVLIFFNMKGIFMHNEAIWATLNENLEDNYFYRQLLTLLENKEELKMLLNNSPCKSGCSGNCSALK